MFTSTWFWAVIVSVAVAFFFRRRILVFLFVRRKSAESIGGWVPHASIPNTDPDSLPTYNPDRDKRHAKMFAEWVKQGYGKNIPKHERVEEAIARVAGALRPETASTAAATTAPTIRRRPAPAAPTVIPESAPPQAA